MPLETDTVDPFGLNRLLKANLFGGTPIPLDPGNPDLGVAPGGTPPLTGGDTSGTPLVPGGLHDNPNVFKVTGDYKSIADNIPNLISSVMPQPTHTQSVVSKLVGAQQGKQDLTGIENLIANMSFQRLWESYNPGKTTDAADWPLQLANSGITRAQGNPLSGDGYLWGYVDPSWLPGWNPGRNVTTITDIVHQMTGGGSPAPSVENALAAMLKDALPKNWTPSTYEPPQGPDVQNPNLQVQP